MKDFKWNLEGLTIDSAFEMYEQFVSKATRTDKREEGGRVTVRYTKDGEYLEEKLKFTKHDLVVVERIYGRIVDGEDEVVQTVQTDSGINLSNRNRIASSLERVDGKLMFTAIEIFDGFSRRTEVTEFKEGDYWNFGLIDAMYKGNPYRQEIKK